MIKLQWQYDGTDNWDVIVAWCKEYVPGQWSTDHYETLHFATEEAFTYFMLRWL